MATQELFIELFSEEIPARMQVKAAQDLQDLVTKGLKAAGLSFDSAENQSTPRRLVVVVKGVPASQPDRVEESRGPKVGAPEQALSGFMKSNGLTSIDEAEQRELPKGTFYFAVKSIKGQATLDVLPALIEKAATNIPWPKSMRWGRSTLRYVRPLHSIIALFGGAIVDGRVQVGEDVAVAFGNTTRGHRFLGPNPIKVSDFDNYARKLNDQKVMLDREDRKDAIVAGLEEFAEANNLKVIEDKALLEEVTGLVEWPVAIVGGIDAEFMSVPKEVLVTSMREHQKFFAFELANGDLAPYFATVANTIPHDGGELIKSGNQRVLSARLSDAKFFWEQDCKHELPQNVPKLSNIVFHAKLGTVGDKVDRMSSVAGSIADLVGADRDKARSAARLSKADLVSSMVYEFPELQGTMGRYYALNDGESPAVADAIAEHYSPLGPQDPCPSQPVSVTVALADKLDTLVGFWLIDEKPTGSKDPFALRRAALGVIRLIVENDLHVSLKHLFAQAHEAYGEEFHAKHINEDLWSFFKDRIKVVLRDKDVRHDIIDALFTAKGDKADEDNLTKLFAKATSLATCLQTEDGAQMVAGYRRACNILAAEEKKAKEAIAYGPVDATLFTDVAETALNDALNLHLTAAGEALAANKFTAAYSEVAALRPAIDAFFKGVMVNDDDPKIRANRLNLLATLRSTVQGIADLSKVGG